MEVGFSYGALSEDLEKQANEQGFSLGKDAEKLEKYRHAILQLRFGIDTPDSIHEKLIQRLHKIVIKKLRPSPLATE